MEHSLLTVKEASSFLKISPSTLYRLCFSGYITHIKKSFGIRFRRVDLEQWLNQDRRRIELAENILKRALTSSFHFNIDNVKGGQGAMAKAKKKRLNCGYGAVYIRKTKRGKPRYYADYRDKQGKRKQRLIRNATDWREAVEGLKNAVLKEHYQECGTKEEKHPIKLKEFSELFIENYSKVNKRSWKDDQDRLRWINDLFGDITLSELSPIHVERLKSEKLKEGVTKTTVNHYLKTLKRMYNIAISWGYAERNPVRGVKFFSERDAQRERILTEEEEDRLLEAASAHLRPILVVALSTGMRRAEILNLKWKHVDFKKREIFIEKSKNGSPRKIDINSALLDELTRLKNRINNQQYVFINPRTGKPYKKVQRSFERARSNAKIEELRFHDLRHTFASRLIERGVDIVKVKEFLGHSTVRTTERYIHPDREEKKKAVELLCAKRPKKAGKEVNLLHIRDMKRKHKDFEFVSSLFSIN